MYTYFILPILYFEFLLQFRLNVIVIQRYRFGLTTLSLAFHILNFAFNCCLFKFGFILPFSTFNLQILLLHFLIFSLNYLFYILSFEFCSSNGVWNLTC